MRTRGASGFTLVELLATVFILAVGLGAVFALITMTAEWSGDQARERRRERFVESVFASAEWAVETETEDEALPWTLPVMTEDAGEVEQTLVVNDDEETAWPREREDGIGSDIPRLYYTLALSTNATGMVEAEVAVRAQGEGPVAPGAAGETRVFRREFHRRRRLF